MGLFTQLNQVDLLKNLYVKAATWEIERIEGTSSQVNFLVGSLYLNGCNSRHK